MTTLRKYYRYFSVTSTQSVLEGFFLEMPLRKLAQDPYKLLRVMGLREGHVLLDVGCGTGFLAFPAASIVGDKGLVYAVDISDKYLWKLRQRAAKLCVKNILPVRARAEELDGVPDRSADRVVFMLSLHHIEDKGRALSQVRRKMKQDSLLMVYEPIASRMLGHGTEPSEIIPLLRQKGFEPYLFEKGRLFWAAIFTPL
ncbi:Aklanonic acid methyltransferase DauC [Candidatus Calditenuaceae archaeon HR02]|nr:Aklanonic acid methyltransferase DauC [Candidatus Calditenuaceae archaeon HR02]